MVVRIRLRFGQEAAAGNLSRQSLVVAAASLMTPLSLMAWALGIWRLAAGMKWTGEFAITEGIFSHWQVWFAVAILVQFAAFLLSRLVHPSDNSSDTALS
jgi:hypothetical protein